MKPTSNSDGIKLRCKFFKEVWISSKAPDRTLCYDITSVSTYASGIDMVEFGYNMDREGWLRQINLALVTDKETHMSLAFRVVNGSLGDVGTLNDTVREFTGYGAKSYETIMDPQLLGEEQAGDTCG